MLDVSAVIPDEPVGAALLCERSRATITSAALARLAVLAGDDREAFLDRNPRWRDVVAGHVLLVCLCQGAAQHYVDGTNGVKDLDVWTFYESVGKQGFPPRRRGVRDYGPSVFGRHPADEGFLGRRVDCLGRSIEYRQGESPSAAVRRYLQEAKTDSARLLAQKPVVVLEPAALRGNVLWRPK